MPYHLVPTDLYAGASETQSRSTCDSAMRDVSNLQIME